MPGKRKNTFDYDAFAPEMRRFPCLWDPKHENYKLADFKNSAFGKIEKKLNLDSKSNPHLLSPMCRKFLKLHVSQLFYLC